MTTIIFVRLVGRTPWSAAGPLAGPHFVVFKAFVDGDVEFRVYKKGNRPSPLHWT